MNGGAAMKFRKLGLALLLLVGFGLVPAEEFEEAIDFTIGRKNKC